MMDHFSKYHPVVNFAYFALVIGFSMMFNHPLAQAISLGCALCCAIQGGGRKSTTFSIKACLPVIFITGIVNPVFNHAGTTMLWYFPNGNPLTLESLLYGVSSGCMIATVLLWFVSFNRVVTSDKFIYLFGRVLPVLSLLLSMTLRFVPRFKGQIERTAQAQRGIGRDVSAGSLWQRAKTAVAILSITVTWAMENAMDTADSMKSRGYGLKGRSAFSIYRFDSRDRMVLSWIALCGIYVLSGAATSAFSFRYFPSIRYGEMNWASTSFFTAYFCLCITPVILNIGEENKWKAIGSNL